MSKFIGKRFGRLIVIRRMDNDKWGNHRWLCKCDCGKEKIISGDSLKRGLTKSCGCLQKEKTALRSIKHGRSNDKIYMIWGSMIARCTNPNKKDWKDYGGRGITVCERWMKFENFLEDMGKRWKPGLTLERTDNKEGYYKLNCKWVTQKENNRNKRNNLYLPYRGENRLLVELCEEHNMPYGVVYKRIYVRNWSTEKAITTPVRKCKRRKKK